MFLYAYIAVSNFSISNLLNRRALEVSQLRRLGGPAATHRPGPGGARRQRPKHATCEGFLRSKPLEGPKNKF